MYLTNDAILLDKNTKRNSEGRTVKFRFWNVSKKTMIVDNPKLFISGNGYIWKFKDHFDIDFMFYKNNKLIPLQWTGLLDKNGKEIYEGDIIHVKTEGWDVKGEVVWNEKKCSFNYFDGEENLSLLKIDNKIYEIIGNIYENP